MKALVLYSTIVGGFYESTDALDAAIHAARTQVGNDTWKRGFSGSEPSGATVAARWHLQDAGISPHMFEGELNYVKFVENRDASGNLYPKLRVSVQNLGDEFMLSLDLKGDVAQRLLVKLDNCQAGDYIRVSAWPTLVERGSRTYINHACSVKGEDGKEIPANTQISADIKKQTDAVEATLKSVNVIDAKLIAAAKTAKRIQAHKDLLLCMQMRFDKAQIEA